jgi:Tfp pilus assembly protein PilO
LRSNAGVDKLDNSLITNKIKENGISLVILVVAVIVAFKIYQSKEGEIAALKSQKVTEEKKNALLGDIGGLEKRIAYLKDNVNNKAISSVLDKIGDFAKTSSVQIAKITPQKEEVLAAYTKYSFELTLSAKDYHQIGKFMSLLESSPDIYMVEELNVAKNNAAVSETFTATMRVYTIMINQ